MLGEVVVSGRFRGPPDSANGGYAAGRLAAYVDAPAVEVRLTAPPPLDRPLAVASSGDGSVELRDDGSVVAVARPAELELEPPRSVALEEAAAAASRTPLGPHNHPFPTCFGCGPLRERGDALVHLCGPVGDGTVTACPATTDPRLPHSSDGALLPEIVWAGLDCPSASAVVPPGSGAHVLGTFTVRSVRPVLVGRPHVCVAWALGADGRKKYGASALLDADGGVCALARATWIALRPPA